MIYHATNGVLTINGKEYPIKADKIEWREPEPAEPIYHPQSFEIEVSIQWTWIAPFAFSLPPAGCVPMYN